MKDYITYKKNERYVSLTWFSSDILTTGQGR